MSDQDRPTERPPASLRALRSLELVATGGATTQRPGDAPVVTPSEWREHVTGVRGLEARVGLGSGAPASTTLPPIA